MRDEAAAGWETFLVEHYRPGLAVDSLRRTAELVRASAAELEGKGRALRYVRSTLVPDDEAFLSIFEAASEGVVREAYARAGIEFERISKVIAAEGG